MRVAPHDHVSVAPDMPLEIPKVIDEVVVALISTVIAVVLSPGTHCKVVLGGTAIGKLMVQDVTRVPVNTTLPCVWLPDTTCVEPQDEAVGSVPEVTIHPLL